jgi:hypothetical protein
MNTGDQMDRQAESATRQTIQRDGTMRIWLVAAFSLWFVFFCSGMLFAQNQSAGPNQKQNGAPTAQVQAPRPGAVATTESVPAVSHSRYNFPEDECSADFWDPYVAESLAITESPARVQDSSLEEIDPADVVQALPDEVVDPAERAQQLDSEVVHPMARVEQLDDEVVKTNEPIGALHPTMPSANAPGDVPDNP